VRSVTRTVRGLLNRRFGSALRFTQLTNLTLLTLAALHGGSLQPATLARRLQTRTTFRHNEKRVHRFAGNLRLPVHTVFERLLGMILILSPKGKLVPVTIVDETDLPGGCQGIVAAIPYLGRALPFAFRIYRYDRMPAGQNVIEREFFSLVACLLRFHKLEPVFILDRGYADVELSRYFTEELKAHFVIRVPNNIYVRLPGYAGRLAKLGRPGQWEAISYHRTKPTRLNLAVFWGKDDYGKDELVYLVTDLPADEAQERYRLRMRIEEDFRDLKTTLGLKHLRPRKDIERRVARLLLVAMVTACVAAYLYPRAVAEQERVVRRQSDVSFVQLVVMVYRLRWSRYVGGVG
jgi:IS4 transposase